MTLDQQVHQQELKIQKLEQRIRELEKNSHPPIDFIDRVVKAINAGELVFEGPAGRKVAVVTRAYRSAHNAI